MTTRAPRQISFAGCSRAEARKRLLAFRHEITDEQVRKAAADWLVADGEYCDPIAFQQEIAQLRAVFNGGDEEALAILERVFDEVYGPEPPA